MHSSTAEMVEKKVLEMAQHASFHQHVSYNLSTILHGFTAGKTDPTEIAEAFTNARGLEVITRVVSGKPIPRPPVISLCCGVARRVIDKFGTGVAESQAGGFVEALVGRLALGISGDDAQSVECQMECACLMSSVAGRAASLLIAGGALGAVEGMLERLGGNHSSIMQPCCEALERVSRTKEGRAVFEERGTAGVLLATIRECPDALEEGSDAALASALMVVDRIFSQKSPEACVRSLRVTAAAAEEEGAPGEDPHLTTVSDYANCVETLLSVAETMPDAPGVSAATCLWWVSGASSAAPDRALTVILEAAEEAVREGTDGSSSGGGGPDVGEDGEGVQLGFDVWSWLPRKGGAAEVGEEADDEAASCAPPPRSLEAARFLAALCLCKPGLQALKTGARRDLPRVVGALVTLSGSTDPKLARPCFRIVERLSRAGIGAAEAFVDAGALAQATEAGKRFEVEEEATDVDDAEAGAIAAALGAVAVLAEAGGEGARPLVEDAFRLSVRCLGRLGEFSGRPAAAAAKAALDVVTYRLTRPDRPKSAAGASIIAPPITDPENGGTNGTGDVNDQGARSDSQSRLRVDAESAASVAIQEVEDAPMEVLGDAGVILAAMKAHPMDARLQESGWRSLIAMDTGRGDVDRFLTGGGGGDGQRSRRQMLKDCLERHGGDSMVAGQVAAILEGLVLHGGDSDGENSLTASLSDTHGEESPRVVTDTDEIDTDDGTGNNVAQGSPLRDGSGSVKTGQSDAVISPDRPPGASESTPPGRNGAAGSAAEGCSPGEGATRSGVVGPEKVDACERLVGSGKGGADGTERGPEVASVEEEGAAANDDVEEGGSIAGVGGGGDAPPTPGTAASGAAGDDSTLQLLSPEVALLELSREGIKALDGDDDDDDTDEALEAGEGGAISGSNLARSLFGDASTVRADGADGVEGGGEEPILDAEDECHEAARVAQLPPVPSEEELKLEKSWVELEKLHGDVTGRSRILGGKSAELTAAMPDPGMLKKEVGAMLEGTNGGESRGAFAASSLAMVGALTAATGALACSQREVQRYLKMSRDLRETSTWNDISEAMQWTMDSLKGTVILFTPHTNAGLTKDLGLCKNMESASKLFKEAALQIKIIVVELAGKHEPNTVWRLARAKFESLPDNRKLMTLRQLRSLVVAYDHLSDERRKELTTALEIIKNREVLNMMGKCCVKAEVQEEHRRVARMANAEEKIKIGTRRPAGARAGMRRRSQSPNPRSTPPQSKGSPNGSASPGSAPLSTVSGGACSPPGGSNGKPSPGSASGKVSPPRDKHWESSPRSTHSESGDSSRSGGGCGGGGGSTGGGGGGGGGGPGILRSIRGIASKPRRRDTAAPPPAASRRSKSPVPVVERRSRSPVPVVKRRSAVPSSPAGSRSKSPVPGVTRSSRSAVPSSPATSRSKSPVPAVTRRSVASSSPAASRSKSPVPVVTRRSAVPSPRTTTRRSQSPVPTRKAGLRSSPPPVVALTRGST